MDSILHLVGIAKKAGKLEVGEEPVGAAARAKHARVILLAADAADNSVRRATHYAEAGGTVALKTPYAKSELGMIVGRSSCAMLAVCDAGLASSIAAKLAAADPEQFGEAAQALATKAEKVLRRQKEQRIHEKNLQQRKAKPWAVNGKTGAEGRLERKQEGKPSGFQGRGAAGPKRTKGEASSDVKKNR